MKIVIPGGTGQVGGILNRALTAAGHEVVVLTRRPSRAGEVAWDGTSPGPWTAVIDGSDVVINLAGRSVSCRYTPANLQEMMRSRVDSARVVGEAIAAAARPPRVWLQMSTATLYTHRFDAPNDEATGRSAVRSPASRTTGRSASRSPRSGSGRRSRPPPRIPVRSRCGPPW